MIGISLGTLIIIPFGMVGLYMLGWGLAGIGVGLLQPAYQSLISKAVPAKLRGTAFGLFGTSLGLISLPAPWIGAQLWQSVSPRFPFLITVLVTFLSIIPIWLKFKLPKNRNGSPIPDSDPQDESQVS